MAPSSPPPPPASSDAKLLCSFGGQILPRLGDGALRYVGGHTRLVSVPKDVTFTDLICRLSAAAGGAAGIKYQLPGEDLDALVSVASPEDLDNMMDEYDKISRSSSCSAASPKIRAFLFPSGGGDAFLDLHNAGQRYLEAVNGFAPLDATNSSIGSSSSNPGGTSPTQNSPPLEQLRVAGKPPLVKVATCAPPQPISSTHFPASPAAQTGNSKLMQERIRYENRGMCQKTLSRAHSDTLVHYHGGHECPGGGSNTNPVFSSHRVEAAMKSETAGCSSRAYGFPQIAEYEREWPILPPGLTGLLSKPPQYPQLPRTSSEDPRMLNFRYADAIRVSNTIGNQSAYPPNLGISIEPPARNFVEPIMQMPPTSSDDARMLNFRYAETGQASNMMESAYPRSLGMNIEPLARNFVEPIMQMPPTSSDDARMLNFRYAETGQVSNMMECAYPPNLGMNIEPPARIFVEPIMQMPLTSSDDARMLNFRYAETGQVSNMMESAYPPNLRMNIEPLAKKIVEPIMQMPPTSSDDARMLNFQYAETGQVSNMMESAYSPNLGMNIEPLARNFVGPIIPMPLTSSDDARMLNLRNADTAQVANMIENHDAYPPNLGRLFEPLVRNFVEPIIQMPPTSLDVACMQNVQHAHPGRVSNTTGNLDLYPPNLGIGIGPPVPNGWVLGMPMYTRSIGPANEDRAMNKTLNGDWRGEASQIDTNDMFYHIPAAQSSNVLCPSSNTTNPTRHVEPLQEPESSDSFFSDEDPWKVVLDGACLLPPRTRWVAKNELGVSKDSCMENYLGNSIDSDIVVLLPEGALCHRSPQSPLNKDLSPEPVRLPKAEKNIKQEMQASDDGVVSPVQPLLPPVPVFVIQETKEHDPELDKEKGIVDDSTQLPAAIPIVDKKIEEIKPAPSDDLIPAALQNTEGIGHLQIIRNSDLEELRELGSGTFGTVYHGKWRGSDVAIKRISDRCFAGKPSEEERMRADFWNEACKLADLHHPNVVALYGVVLDGPGGSVATVTEYMVNGSLRTALRRNDKILDRRKRLLITMDVAFGMEYLHEKNIVHFDLKSDNLMVNLRDPQRPICKVGDLGLSKMKCKTMVTGGVRGTLPWMAPELLDGSRSLVSEKVDVFSFGVVMWELLTGEEPYADMHYGAIIGGIVSNTLRPPVPLSCDPEWRSLMENCWSSEPSERPSFTEIANRLRLIAASLRQKIRS